MASAGTDGLGWRRATPGWSSSVNPLYQRRSTRATGLTTDTEPSNRADIYTPAPGRQHNVSGDDQGDRRDLPTTTRAQSTQYGENNSFLPELPPPPSVYIHPPVPEEQILHTPERIAYTVGNPLSTSTPSQAAVPGLSIDNLAIPGNGYPATSLSLPPTTHADVYLPPQALPFPRELSEPCAVPSEMDMRPYHTAARSEDDSWAAMSSAITYKLPLLLYQAFLIRMPVFYYGRVARVLEDAELSLADVKKLAFTTASDWRNKDDQQREEALYQLNHFGNWSSTPQYAAQVTPAMRRFRGSWESFIDALIQEWKTQNVISALLLSALLAMLQIDAAASDVVTRTTAILSLIAALMSLLYSCLYIVRFGTMKRMHKASAWADEARKTRDHIFWNVWVLLSLPITWLIWSIVFFIASIVSYVWRTGSNSKAMEHATSNRATLGSRIGITCMLGLGIFYLVAMCITFTHYGDEMDTAWRRQVASMVQQLIPDVAGAAFATHGLPTSSGQHSHRSRSRQPLHPYLADPAPPGSVSFAHLQGGPPASTSPKQQTPGHAEASWDTLHRYPTPFYEPGNAFAASRSSSDTSTTSSSLTVDRPTPKVYTSYPVPPDPFAFDVPVPSAWTAPAVTSTNATASERSSSPCPSIANRHDPTLGQSLPPLPVPAPHVPADRESVPPMSTVHDARARLRQVLRLGYPAHSIPNRPYSPNRSRPQQGSAPATSTNFVFVPHPQLSDFPAVNIVTSTRHESLGDLTTRTGRKQTFSLRCPPSPGNRERQPLYTRFSEVGLRACVSATFALPVPPRHAVTTFSPRQILDLGSGHFPDRTDDFSMFGTVFLERGIDFICYLAFIARLLRLYDISSKEPIYSQILGSAPSEAAGAIAVFSELQVWNERYLCQRGMAAVLTQEHRRGTVGHYVYLVDIQDGPLLNALVLNETFKHRLSPAPIERVCLYLFDRHPPLPPAGERVDTHVMIDMETLTIRWPASGVDWLAELPAHPIALSLVKVHLSPSSARSLSVTRLRPSFGSSEPPGPQSAPMGDSFVSDGPSTRSPEHGRAPHVGSQAATQTAHTNLPVIDILTDSSPESIVGDLGGDFLVHQAHRGESATAAGGPVSPVARPHNTLGPDCNCDWCGT